MTRLPVRLSRAILGGGLLLAVTALPVTGLPGQGENAGASTPSAATPSEAAPSQELPAQEPIVQTFGTSGEKGSYKVWFEPRGGSVRAVQLRDHYRSAEAREREVKESGDYYLIADVPDRQAAPYSFVVEELNDSFPKVDTALDTWRRVETDGNEVAFALDCGDGIELRKVFGHAGAGRRGLSVRIEVRVAEGASPKVRDVQLLLRGLSLLNPVGEHIFGQNPALGLGVRQVGDERVVESVRATGDPKSKPFERGEFVFAGTTNRFFASFLRPTDDRANRALRAVRMDFLPGNAPIDNHKPYSIPVAVYELDIKLPAPGGVTGVDYEVFLGPKSAGVFDEQPEYAAFDAVLDIDLSPVCFCDIPGARSLAKVLLWTLRGLHSVVGNWGVAIILLTILVRSLMLPLNFRMQKSMRVYGAKMARLKPQLDELQAKVKKDPKKYQKDMIAFQREHKLFPPVGGCLPMMLVSFPVFIGLFTALRVAYELRNQPFFGWIHDLSQPDMLFMVGQSWMPYFNLLPIIMVCLWLYLQMATPLPKDPQQRQMMQIMRFMPLMFGIMLYNYASGLMVYMITSSLYALIETRVTKRILGPMPTAGGVSMPATF